MGDLLLDNQGTPTAPSSGQSIPYADSTSKKLVCMDDSGNVLGKLSRNFATANQSLGTTETYVTNSGIVIPSCGLQAGMVFRWFITGSKTAAGTAAAVYNFKLGTNQTTADTTILALTAGAQTGVVDNGLLTITGVITNSSASGLIAGAAAWAKTQAGTAGLGGSIDGVSATFNATGRAGQFMGVSITPGATSAWTITSVHGELLT